jgi:hypothetical protein
MNRERFQTLAEAYGGDVQSWPADDRDPAAVLLASDHAWASAVLGEASRLDGVLALSLAPAPSSVLVGRVIAAASGTRRRLAWLLPAGLGAGLAAACAAGLLAGVQLSRTAIEDQAVSTAVADDDASLLIDEAA